MSRVTSKQISKAIEKATGHEGVTVYVSMDRTYCYFAGKDDGVSRPVDEFEETTVHCVGKLSDMSVEEWVSEYVSRFKEIETFIDKPDKKKTGAIKLSRKL